MTEETAKFRVLADYEVIDPHPLRVPEDAAVEVLREDDSWPGWVWIRFGKNEGWIPASYLGPVPEASLRRCQRAFDGVDLSAQRGEILEALETVSGWILARRENGETGWFPLFNLKPVPRT